jgi:hypothetical protein
MVDTTTTPTAEESKSGPKKTTTSAEENKTPECAAFKVGKLTGGHTATKWRLNSGKIVDLTLLNEEEALKLADDKSIKFYVRK